jgi:hypothetical protein
MDRRSPIETVKRRGATRLAGDDLRALYRQAFEVYGTRALWSSRPVDRPPLRRRRRADIAPRIKSGGRLLLANLPLDDPRLRWRRFWTRSWNAGGTASAAAPAPAKAGADDCNINVRSKAAGERVMASVTSFLENRLRLKVNRQKSAVAPVGERGVPLLYFLAAAYIVVNAGLRRHDDVGTAGESFFSPVGISGVQYGPGHPEAASRR